MDIAKCVDFDFFLSFIEGLQAFLGDGCEIVIHDFRKGYEHAIVHIINGKVSGRSVGGSPRGAMIVHEGKPIDAVERSQVFFYNGKKGELFKSCTTLLCDENDIVIGSVCVNMEVSGLLMAQSAIGQLVQYQSPVPESASGDDGIVARNVDDVLQFYMSKAEQIIGKSMAIMNKEEKIRALDFLEDKGVMKITKANVLLCEAFNISKFTLYNYLDEVRAARSRDAAQS